MKIKKDFFEFYESPVGAIIGMVASVIFAILGFIQPGPIKEPLYVSIIVATFPLMFFFFFLMKLKKPFILLNAEKIVIQKQTFYFSDISGIFFYRAEGGGYRFSFPNEMLDIRLKGEKFPRVLWYDVPRHAFILSFMSYSEMRLLEEQLRLLQKVEVMHLPPQDRQRDLPQLNIPTANVKEYTPNYYKNSKDS